MSSRHAGRLRASGSLPSLRHSSARCVREPVVEQVPTLRMPSIGRAPRRADPSRPPRHDSARLRRGSAATKHRRADDLRPVGCARIGASRARLKSPPGSHGPGRRLERLLTVVPTGKSDADPRSEDPVVARRINSPDRDIRAARRDSWSSISPSSPTASGSGNSSTRRRPSRMASPDSSCRVNEAPEEAL